MSLALDTNVVIPWLVASAPFHEQARRAIEQELSRDGGRIALTMQVCWEFVHVSTDNRRFERPLSMGDAVALIRRAWNARETERILASVGVVGNALALLDQHRLGRKRILDTVLAATLEEAGVRRLATANRADFACFGFIEVVEPF